MKPAGNDQKKLLVLSVLGILLLGVGAFQMAGGGGSAPVLLAQKADASPPEKSAEEQARDEEANLLGQDGLVVGVLAPRDPFVPQAGRDAGKSGGATATPVNQPVADPLPTPAPMEAPEPPMPGEVTLTDGGQSAGTTPVAPSQPLRPSYMLTGVITGDRDVAVLRSSEGKDRTVVVGDVLATGERVISITATKVVLKTNEGTFTLTLGKNDEN
jgi:N-acetylmuramic acid 6-phosphate (MurNAc-6-P) etherase